jgi:hypothetical protein
MVERCKKCLSKRVVSIIVTQRAVVVHRDDVSVTSVPPELGMTDLRTGQIAFDLCLTCGHVQGSWPAAATPLDDPALGGHKVFQRGSDHDRSQRRRRAFGRL